MFLPSGVPVEIALLLVPIEFVSYIARIFSLSIRLFANMMSGHALLKILIGFS
jgi:F0F1-type ATP synthase membrane subunit a